MPRPADGYRNSAGDKVPGVHDIFKSFLNKGERINAWAHKRGRMGLPLHEPGTFAVGHAVHAMAEMELRGRSVKAVEALTRDLDPADVDKARAAFDAFRRWHAAMDVRPIAHEVAIVSDTLQLGGTPDCIAIIDGAYALLDFKTCSHVPDQPYDEQTLAAAAHSKLWNEAHPDRRVESAHIVYLPKDGTAPGHCVITDLAANWLVYWHLLRAYQRRHSYPAPVLPPDPRDAEIAWLRERLAAQLMVTPPKPKRPATVGRSPKRAWEDDLSANVVTFPGRP